MRPCGATTPGVTRRSLDRIFLQGYMATNLAHREEALHLPAADRLYFMKDTFGRWYEGNWAPRVPERTPRGQQVVRLVCLLP
jgi:hypothetical protein